MTLDRTTINTLLKCPRIGIYAVIDGCHGCFDLTSVEEVEMALTTPDILGAKAEGVPLRTFLLYQQYHTSEALCAGLTRRGLPCRNAPMVSQKRIDEFDPDRDIYCSCHAPIYARKGKR